MITRNRKPGWFIASLGLLLSVFSTSAVACSGYSCGGLDDNYLNLIYVFNCTNQAIFPQIQQNSQQATQGPPNFVQPGLVKMSPGAGKPGCGGAAIMISDADMRSFNTAIGYNYLITGLAGSAVSIGQNTQGSDNFHSHLGNLQYGTEAPGFQSYPSLQAGFVGPRFGNNTHISVATLISPQYASGAVTAPAFLTGASSTMPANCQSGVLTHDENVSSPSTSSVCKGLNPAKSSNRDGNVTLNQYGYWYGNLCVQVCMIAQTVKYYIYVLPHNNGNAVDPNYRQYPGNSGP